jgi:hypothetical protein
MPTLGREPTGQTYRPAESAERRMVVDGIQTRLWTPLGQVAAVICGLCLFVSGFFVADWLFEVWANSTRIVQMGGGCALVATVLGGPALVAVMGLQWWQQVMGPLIDRERVKTVNHPEVQEKALEIEARRAALIQAMQEHELALELAKAQGRPIHVHTRHPVPGQVVELRSDALDRIVDPHTQQMAREVVHRLADLQEPRTPQPIATARRFSWRAVLFGPPVPPPRRVVRSTARLAPAPEPTHVQGPVQGPPVSEDMARRAAAAVQAQGEHAPVMDFDDGEGQPVTDVPEWVSPARLAIKVARLVEAARAVYAPGPEQYKLSHKRLATLDFTRSEREEIQRAFLAAGLASKGKSGALTVVVKDEAQASVRLKQWLEETQDE